MNRTSPEWISPLIEQYKNRATLLLLFDYDGSLTPIVPHPDQAILSEEMRDLLSDLSALDRIRIGVISGRSLADVRRRIGISGLYYSGCSGAELDLLGQYEEYPHALSFREGMQLAIDQLAPVVERYLGAWIERKPLGMTIHYRDVLSPQQSFLKNEVRLVLTGLHGLHMLDVREALEITAHEGWDKGTAVRKILTHIGHPVLPLYVGDSMNDEPAMEVVNYVDGITVGVGPTAPTIARVLVPNHEDIYHGIRLLREEIQR